MSKPLTLKDIDRLMRDYDPATIRANKRNAESIAQMGAWYAEEELRNQEKRNHKISGFERREFRDIESLPKSPAKRKRKSVTKPREKTLATVCVSFTLRDPVLYWYDKPLVDYVTAYKRGFITRGELDAIINYLKGCAK